MAPTFLGLLLILAFLCQHPFASAKCNHTQVENCIPYLGYCHCIPCKACPPGEGLEPQCGSQVVMQFPRCLKCIQGETYSQKLSIASCHPCPICEGKEILQSCNLTHPTICDDGCKDGYEMNAVGMCALLDNDDSLTTPNVNPTIITIKQEDKRSMDNNTSVTLPPQNRTMPTTKPPSVSGDGQSGNSVATGYIIGCLGSIIGLCIIIIFIFIVYKKWEMITTQLRITRGSQNIAREEEALSLQIMIPDSLRLNSISPSLEQSICTKLNKRTRGVKNWQHIGYEYGVDRNDLDTMEQAYQKDNTGPAECLLQKIHTLKPQETLKSFINILRKMRRNDVLEVIEKEYSQ